MHEQNGCREFSRIGEDAILLPDSHVYPLYSPDSKMEQAEAICAAIASGVTNGCFTEHMDLGHYMESIIYKRYLETVYDSIMDDNLTEYYDCVRHIGYIAKCNHYNSSLLE